MGDYALFIDYEWCSGCKSCEIACRNEHDIPRGQFGIRVLEDKPWKMKNGCWHWNYIPMPSNLCDLCEGRVKRGKEPSCVQHCQAKCIEFGTIDALREKMADKKMTMIIRP